MNDLLVLPGRTRQVVILLAALLSIAGAGLFMARPASATIYGYCDYRGVFGGLPGFTWCEGERHSLTGVEYHGDIHGGTHVCTRTRDDTGAYTATYCALDDISGGPYCGCVLRYPQGYNNEFAGEPDFGNAGY